MTYRDINLEKLIIYDIETLKSAFILCARDYKSGQKKEFIIYGNTKYEDQPQALFTFIKNCITAGYTFCGFNNIAFDAQVVHLFYDWCCDKQDPLHTFDNKFIIEQLYKKAQELINTQDEKEKYKMMVSENKLFCPQIDLYKQMHYDRSAKATSLKWLEFSMRMPLIQEMPIAHDEELQLSDIDEVVRYCWNDVDSTTEFFNRIKFQTEVRLDLSKEYGLNLINASEPKMVREIFGKFLCKEMAIPYSELKQKKTIRTKIPFRDIIFPYVTFLTPTFKDVLDIFKTNVINATPNYSWSGNKLGIAYNVKQQNDKSLKELREETNMPELTRDESKFSYSFRFHNMDVDLGLGGIHACVDSGVYTHNEDEVIEDADGKSFYPFLAIKNDIRPEHLGKAYNVVYPMMYEQRLKYDKKDPRNYVFKIILNSAYGLSKEINGYLYDPKYTYGVTINGQLTLLMLAEALDLAIPDIMFLQMNTDGLTYKYNKKYTEKVRIICKWWEAVTKIELEYGYYSKMIIVDVNNYMAINEEGKLVKKKGLFETEMEYHKNPSSLIIPKALQEYFINKLTPEQYITDKKHTIFDFCNGVKKKSNFDLNLVQNLNFAELIVPQQRVCRFIVSKKTDNTGLLYKDFHEGNRTSVMANTQVLPLNYINPEQQEAYLYTVDYQHYVKECRKIIEIIEPSTIQTTLF